MENDRLVIAIDGPAGSGKSTIAKKVSQVLKIEYIDTGAMYRALTLKILKLNININNLKEVLEILKDTSIKFENNHIYLDGIIVDKDIRKNIINNNVSEVSKIKEIRQHMVKIQQELAKHNNVIMDGRDIGTVVFPNANYKFFLTAKSEERAKRRHKQLLKKNEIITYEQVLEEIKERDKIDSTREIAPLIKSPDAYEIDTTNKTIKETVNNVLAIIEGR